MTSERKRTPGSVLDDVPSARHGRIVDAFLLLVKSLAGVAVLYAVSLIYLLAA